MSFVRRDCTTQRASAVERARPSSCARVNRLKSTRLFARARHSRNDSEPRASLFPSRRTYATARRVESSESNKVTRGMAGEASSRRLHRARVVCFPARRLRPRHAPSPPWGASTGGVAAGSFGASSGETSKASSRGHASSVKAGSSTAFVGSSLTSGADASSSERSSSTSVANQHHSNVKRNQRPSDMHAPKILTPRYVL